VVHQLLQQDRGLLHRLADEVLTGIKWLTDITEHPTAEGKLYLCAVKD